MTDTSFDRIIKRSGIGVLGEDVPEREIPEWCTSCPPHAGRLGPRHYFDEDGKPRQPDSDWYNWKQCGLCGKIIEVYKIKKEGHIISEIDLPASPFDTVGEIKSLSSRTSRKRGENKRDRRADLINFVKDPDIKREIKQGGKLVSYSER